MRIYLCGPINGCTDDEAHGWRDVATTAIRAAGHDVLDPMVRDYRGQEDERYQEIVMSDLAEIGYADAVLVNAERPSWGTAMEVRAAFDMRPVVRIVAFCPGPVSPWLRYHADVRPTLQAALDALLA